MMATSRVASARHPLLSKRCSFFFLAATTTTRVWVNSGPFPTAAFCLDPPREFSRRSSIKERYYSASSRRDSVSIEQESDFDSEIQVAVAAVRKACEITTRVQADIMDTAEGSTITKADASPVTIADFASQAVVLRHLKSFFPKDVFLAEERSDTLTPQATVLIQRASGIDDEEVLKDCIDLGQQFFTRTNQGDCGEGHESSTVVTHSRFWCLDPIDGTKGFLRKEQYCVALGLVEDGIPTIGILACPNLPPSSNGNNEGRGETGTIFVARRGHGCYELPLIPASHPPIQLTMGSSDRIHDAARARFCVGVEQAFSDPVGRCKEMAKILHGSLDTDGEILHSSRMDSQAKWGVIARGDSEFYVRLPRSDHREWLWDIAPGVVVLEEVGGKVTDAAGKCLDFSQGARLNSNGILGAATADLHAALLDAYRIR